jgi:hypothetical protein
MAINIFLFFPETEDQILGSNTHNIINDFIEISKTIKGKSEIKIYYDSKNIDSFKVLNEILEIYLNDDFLKLRIHLSKRGASDIEDKSIFERTSYYFQWIMDNLAVINCCNIVKETTERKIQYNEELFLLINFNNSIDSCRERILVFKDAKYKNDSPEKFVHIEFVKDFFEFEIWLKALPIKGFTLLDKSKFRRTSLVQQGKPVFQSIDTNDFWYLDNFHKDEYEVFNSEKGHLGVANLNGEIDTSKKVVGRTF